MQRMHTHTLTASAQHEFNTTTTHARYHTHNTHTFCTLARDQNSAAWSARIFLVRVYARHEFIKYRHAAKRAHARVCTNFLAMWRRTRAHIPRALANSFLCTRAVARAREISVPRCHFGNVHPHACTCSPCRPGQGNTHSFWQPATSAHAVCMHVCLRSLSVTAPALARRKIESAIRMSNCVCVCVHNWNPIWPGQRAASRTNLQIFTVLQQAHFNFTLIALPLNQPITIRTRIYWYF